MSRVRKNWTKEETDYLMDKWGSVSVDTIAKNLGRPKGGIINKARRLGLGAFLESGEYVSFNQLYKALGKTGGYTYTRDQWVDKGFPMKNRKVGKCSFRIVYLSDFWDWAQENQTLIDFSSMEPLALGPEPKWLKDQRVADKANAYFLKTPWTAKEDAQLERMLGEYRYTYRELSLRLKRTEGAIKRRMCDLGIKARPVKMSNHNPWTHEETIKLVELYNKGHRPGTMADFIPRSAQAISGKIERLIKEGTLHPRSDFRKSC